MIHDHDPRFGVTTMGSEDYKILTGGDFRRQSAIDAFSLHCVAKYKDAPDFMARHYDETNPRSKMRSAVEIKFCMRSFCTVINQR